MSELKAYKMVNEMYCTDVRVIPAEVYFKSEADKVIAELKKERDWLAKDRAQAYDDLEKRAQLNIKQEESIRHSNHKRCLAMAKACHEKSERMYCEASTSKSLNEIIGNVPKDAVVEKFELLGAIASTHCKRWLELAEKFKEAK